MAQRSLTPAAIYAAVVEAFKDNPEVGVGTSGKKGFGSSALTVHGKIFAMLGSNSQFVVKLPWQRVDALIAAGRGKNFDPGRGRLMKEWLVVESAPASVEEWLPLAREALAFVAAKR